MNTELEEVPTEVLLRATFAAQREAHSEVALRELDPSTERWYEWAWVEAYC